MGRINSLAVLMVIVGIWLLTNTIVGDLPGRILSWRPS